MSKLLKPNEHCENPTDPDSVWVKASQDDYLEYDAHFNYYYQTSEPIVTHDVQDGTHHPARNITKAIIEQIRYTSVNKCSFNPSETTANMFNMVRDRSSTYSGFQINQVPAMLTEAIKTNALRKRIVLLDATDFTDDTVEGTTSRTPGLDALSRLMYHSEQVIEDGIANTFKTREAIDFMKANDRSTFAYSGNGKKEYGDGNESEFFSVPRQVWEFKGFWLDSELREISEFRKNFDTLIITNIAKHIARNEFQPAKLFHLFAALGRVNTQIIFVG